MAEVQVIDCERKLDVFTVENVSGYASGIYGGTGYIDSLFTTQHEKTVFLLGIG